MNMLSRFSRSFMEIEVILDLNISFYECYYKIENVNQIVSLTVVRNITRSLENLSQGQSQTDVYGQEDSQISCAVTSTSVVIRAIFRSKVVFRCCNVIA